MARKPSAKQKLFEHVEVPEGLETNAGVALKPCCLCGGVDVKLVYRQAHFPVVCCHGCGLVYADEHFKQDDLSAFYTGDYYQRAYVCHPREIDGKIAEDYMRQFRRIDRRAQGGRLLDFGSARGTFLQALTDSDMGPRWDVEGVDINPDEVAMGQALGIPVRVADIFSGDVASGEFDAVTAFSVIEHMQDPSATMVELARVLKPGGQVLLIVPNGSCLIVKLGRLASVLFGERARSFSDNVFHEEHLYYFNPKTIRTLFQQTGFELTEIGFTPSYLETHPPGPLVAAGAYGIRLVSWMVRRQTMLLAVGRKI